MTAPETHDELAIGARLQGGSRTITDAEIAFLPALMGAISPLFHDDVRARNSPMGGRILYGPALLGIAIALTEPLLHHRAMGLVELRTVRFRRPVRGARAPSRRRIPGQRGAGRSRSLRPGPCPAYPRPCRPPAARQN